MGALVDHGASHCGRCTGGRGGLDSRCGLEWCLSNRGEDRAVEAQISSSQKELGPVQQQQEWRGELRPEKAATSTSVIEPGD